MTTTYDRLRNRLVELEDQIEECARRMSLLNEERDELLVAKRVWERLDPDDGLEDDYRVAPRFFEVTINNRIDQKKPLDAPTLPEMIVLALKDARGLGKPSLSPKEITDYVKTRWWSAASINSIGPVAWRMAVKEKRLQKSGSLYSLPENETPAVSAAGVSEPSSRSRELLTHPPHDTGLTEEEVV